MEGECVRRELRATSEYLPTVPCTRTVHMFHQKYCLLFGLFLFLFGFFWFDLNTRTLNTPCHPLLTLVCFICLFRAQFCNCDYGGRNVYWWSWKAQTLRITVEVHLPAIPLEWMRCSSQQTITGVITSFPERIPATYTVKPLSQAAVPPWTQYTHHLRKQINLQVTKDKTFHLV